MPHYEFLDVVEDMYRHSKQLIEDKRQQFAVQRRVTEEYYEEIQHTKPTKAAALQRQLEELTAEQVAWEEETSKKESFVKI